MTAAADDFGGLINAWKDNQDYTQRILSRG